MIHGFGNGHEKYVPFLLPRSFQPKAPGRRIVFAVVISSILWYLNSKWTQTFEVTLLVYVRVVFSVVWGFIFSGGFLIIYWIVFFSKIALISLLKKKNQDKLKQTYLEFQKKVLNNFQKLIQIVWKIDLLPSYKIEFTCKKYDIYTIVTKSVLHPFRI